MTKLTICMYGAASDRIDSIYINAAEALGKEIAKRHHKLIIVVVGSSGLDGSDGERDRFFRLVFIIQLIAAGSHSPGKNQKERHAQ